MTTEKQGTGPDPRPVEGFINGLPAAVTQRSSSAAELAVIGGLYGEGDK